MSTNYINQIDGSNGTTYDLAESLDTRIFRATCTTAASTAAKIATLDNDVNFTLSTGVRVAVTFQYGNSATTPTLRVDGAETGTAKTIAVPTSATAFGTGNGTTYNTWGPYETVVFTYNGTYWIRGNGRAIYNAYQKGEANQNAFSNVKVGSTTIAADSTTDTLELVAGSNITLTPDATNDKVTISTTGGGGGGDTVTITPTLSSGEKIADYSINGSSGELYAPSYNGLFYKRALTSSDNVNSITDTGIYYIAGSTPTGIASAYTYSYLTVINNGYYIIQELRKPINGVLAMREKSGDPAVWSDWVWTDYVIDSGTHSTNGSFKWEKWSNGRSRIWGYYSAGTISYNSSYGNLYFRNSTNSFTFPTGLFNVAPLKVNLTAYASAGILGVSCSGITATSVSFYIWSAKNESRSTYVYIDIEGTWK